MHENGTNDMQELNVTDITNSILYTILVNNIGTISTSMADIYNETSTTYVELSQENDNNQRLWNFSKTAVTLLSESSTSMPFNTSRSITTTTTTTTYIPTTTLDSFDEFGPPEGVEYIFVPLGVVVSVIILSAVVWVAISLLSLPRDVFSPFPVLIFCYCTVETLEKYKECNRCILKGMQEIKY